MIVRPAPPIETALWPWITRLGGPCHFLVSEVVNLGIERSDAELRLPDAVKVELLSSEARKKVEKLVVKWGNMMPKAACST
jgi:hypothetical protein